jgi:hypothetical protein
MEGEGQMIEVIFPKRPPTPRELGTRPVPSDYRPKNVRAVGDGGADSDLYYSDEPPSLLDSAGINLHKLEDELTRNRLTEIATLVRALTYGEMMQFAHAICKIRREGTIDQQSLPMMLHLWSTSSHGSGPADSEAADGKTAEQ